MTDEDHFRLWMKGACGGCGVSLAIVDKRAGGTPSDQ